MVLKEAANCLDITEDFDRILYRRPLELLASGTALNRWGKMWSQKASSDMTLAVLDGSSGTDLEQLLADVFVDLWRCIAGITVEIAFLYGATEKFKQEQADIVCHFREETDSSPLKPKAPGSTY